MGEPFASTESSAQRTVFLTRVFGLDGANIMIGDNMDTVDGETFSNAIKKEGGYVECELSKSGFRLWGKPVPRRAVLSLPKQKDGECRSPVGERGCACVQRPLCLNLGFGLATAVGFGMAFRMLLCRFISARACLCALSRCIFVLPIQARIV